MDRLAYDYAVLNVDKVRLYDIMNANFKSYIYNYLYSYSDSKI